jgi:hypothetical protein
MSSASKKQARYFRQIQGNSESETQGWIFHQNAKPATTVMGPTY